MFSKNQSYYLLLFILVASSSLHAERRRSNFFQAMPQARSCPNGGCGFQSMPFQQGCPSGGCAPRAQPFAPQLGCNGGSCGPSTPFQSAPSAPFQSSGSATIHPIVNTETSRTTRVGGRDVEPGAVGWRLDARGEVEFIMANGESENHSTNPPAQNPQTQRPFAPPAINPPPANNSEDEVDAPVLPETAPPVPLPATPPAAQNRVVPPPPGGFPQPPTPAQPRVVSFWAGTALHNQADVDRMFAQEEKQKLIVLTFGSYACRPCRDLNSTLQARFSNNNRLALYHVSMASNAATNLSADDRKESDAIVRTNLPNQFGGPVTGYPTTIVLQYTNGSWRLKNRAAGGLSEEQLSQMFR